MLGRCNNPQDPGYADYGARGVKVLFATKQEYIQYVCSLPGFDLYLELDRINNDGNYAPGNLRWVTRDQNMRNRRDNIKVRWQDQEMVFTDFVRNYTNLSRAQARKMFARGYSLEEIAAHVPADVGRRGQSIRLGKLRPGQSVHGRQFHCS